MTLCLLVGGPDDGRFFEFPDQPWNGEITTARQRPPNWRDVLTWGPNDPPARWWYDREVYREEKIGCPDYWALVVYVHSSVDLNEVGEDALIDIVMRHWRESNRRKAERLQYAQ